MFRLVRPREREVPVVVEVPHASVALPEEVRATLLVSADAIRRDADSYVDELYRDAPSHGATLLSACASRYVVDLNRDDTDVDEWAVRGVAHREKEFPRGVIWRESGDGKAALRSPISRGDFEARLATYYRPYHGALREALTSLRARHGRALLVAAHSMPSTAPSPHGGPRVRRADVVPGTQGRTTAARALIDAVDAHFRSAGLSVRHDDPYRGGATTVRWGRPHEGFHAIQIELNRALYMNEATGDPKPDGVAWVTALCGSLVERLGEVISNVRV